MLVELNEICDVGGVPSNILKLQGISKKEEFKEIEKNKHRIFSIDKLRIQGGEGFILIVMFKNLEKVIYYFKNKRTCEEYLEKLNHLMGKKV